MDIQQTIHVQYTDEWSFELNMTLEHDSLCYDLEIPMLKESDGVGVGSESKPIVTSPSLRLAKRMLPWH